MAKLKQNFSNFFQLIQTQQKFIQNINKCYIHNTKITLRSTHLFIGSIGCKQPAFILREHMYDINYKAIYFYIYNITTVIYH